MGAPALAIAGIVATVASTAIGAVASKQQGEVQTDAANNQAKYNAAVARNNQLIAEQNARYAEQAGGVKEQAVQRQTAGVIGAQRAVAAAHGLDVNSGTPLSLQADTAGLGTLDALTIRHNAAREAYGYRTQAQQYAGESDFYRSQREDNTAGWLAGAGSLIGGASSIADKWLSFSNAGIGAGAPTTPDIWV